MVLKIIGLTAIMVAVFIIVRRAWLARGGRRCDEEILASLAPITEPLARGEAVEAVLVHQAAEAPQVRPLLYAALVQHDAAELFPQELLAPPELARALLAHWVMHPNELQEAPVELAPERIVQRRVDGKNADFHVLRLRMREGHWVGRGWILGVAGPFFEGDEPFAEHASAFCRAGDQAESTELGELVDWFVGLVRNRK